MRKLKEDIEKDKRQSGLAMLRAAFAELAPDGPDEPVEMPTLARRVLMALLAAKKTKGEEEKKLKKKYGEDAHVGFTPHQVTASAFYLWMIYEKPEEDAHPFSHAAAQIIAFAMGLSGAKLLQEGLYSFINGDTFYGVEEFLDAKKLGPMIRDLPIEL